MSSENKRMSVKNILHHHSQSGFFQKCFFTDLNKSTGPGFSSQTVLVPGISTCCQVHTHIHQVTLLPGPGHLHLWHQQAEQQINPTRNSCAKYALSKIRVSRCFFLLDWCGWHSVPLQGAAQTRSWLKLFVYSSIWPERIKYIFWDTLISI